MQFNKRCHQSATSIARVAHTRIYSSYFLEPECVERNRHTVNWLGSWSGSLRHYAQRNIQGEDKTSREASGSEVLCQLVCGPSHHGSAISAFEG